MRCFFSVELPETIKKEAIILFKKYPNTHFTDLKNLHFTLKFIGETEKISDLIKSVKEISFKKFKLKLSNVGCFPDKNNIRILWLGVSEGREELSELANVIDSKTKDFRVNEHESFVPHLTIARCNNNCDKKILYEDFQSSVFEVSKFYLMSSTLTWEGPVYNVVKEFNLI
ncbi:MAG: RNA 2',3'-cyclic phosphodiesterase [Nanoarchaeota archaeon]|nr:RNA 2',3'-cyclic phosphodiesterase [Nanoarchaeota archaeon]